MTSVKSYTAEDTYLILYKVKLISVVTLRRLLMGIRTC